MTTEQITQTVDSIKSYMAQCTVAMQEILKREGAEISEQLSLESAIDYNIQHKLWKELKDYLLRIETITHSANRFISNNLG